MRQVFPSWHHAARAFTLLELLAAMAVLALVMVLITGMLSHVNRAWVSGEQRVEAFQNGRAVLELMSRELSQAAVSNKLQFVHDPSLPGALNLAPNAGRIFWQAPLASTPRGSLCAVGYYLTRTDPTGGKPGRYQLRRLFVSPDSDAERQAAGATVPPSYYRIYDSAPSATQALWVSALPSAAFQDPSESSNPADSASSIVSDGVVAFWMRCLDANGDPIPWLDGFNASASPLKFNSAAAFFPGAPGASDSFQYTNPSSTLPAHRLPSAVEITLVTLDSRTLKHSPAIPQMEAPANPAEIPAKITKFMDDLRANGVQTAHLFSTVVRLVNSGDTPAAP